VGLAKLLLVFHPNVGDETPFATIARNATRPARPVKSEGVASETLCR
jgi:hypothetical protein